jgi:hypothetical protein
VNEVLTALRRALREATDAGLLDELQAYCNSPDSINDVCDAAAAMQEAAAGVGGTDGR